MLGNLSSLQVVAASFISVLILITDEFIEVSLCWFVVMVEGMGGMVWFLMSVMVLEEVRLVISCRVVVRIFMYMSMSIIVIIW